MARKEKDWDWKIATGIDGNYSYEGAQLAVLLDIRDEAKETKREIAIIARSLGWDGHIARNIRGLRRDIKSLAKKIAAAAEELRR